MDIKVVISIKYGWNTIVWAPMRHQRHFVQNLLGVKVHTSCKIPKFWQHFGAKKTHVDITRGKIKSGSHNLRKLGQKTWQK